MTLPFAFALVALAVARVPQDAAARTVHLQAQGLPRAVANDNRAPAGRRVVGDTLVLFLSAPIRVR